MKPLSSRKRRIYVALMVVLFFVSVPLAIFYASGYRYKDGFGFVRTGGLFLSVPYDNATIFLDGEEIEHTGFLNKSFFVDDLAPSSYEVRAVREGSHVWSRTLRVESQVVTKAAVVLPPLQPLFVRLTKGGITSSTTRGVSTAVYDAYSAAFRTYATSTRDNDIIASVEEGNIHVRWMDSGRPPDNFCYVPAACVAEITVEDGEEHVLSVAFFEGGIVYATRESGVHFAEIDVRTAPLSVPLYPIPGAGMRVVDGSLIIKDGSQLYLLEEF